MPQTLCWDCRNSTEKGCSWAAVFEPVKGWTAEETKQGYMVKSCPEFNRDSYEGGAIKVKDYEEVLIRRRWRAAKATLRPVAP